MSSMEKNVVTRMLALTLTSGLMFGALPAYAASSPPSARQVGDRGLKVILPPVAAAALPPVAATVASRSVPPALRDSTEGNIPAALQRWEMLRANANYTFREYASFLVTYPGWPDNDRLRQYAERASDIGVYPSGMLVDYFDRMPPVTNAGRAVYALALQSERRGNEALDWARKAWRGGPLDDVMQARLLGAFGNDFTPADHDARMGALISSGATTAAATQLGWTSAERRDAFSAALGYRNGGIGATLGGAALSDPSYMSQRARYLMRSGQSSAARQLLATRPALGRVPFDAEDWYEILLSAARDAENNGDYRTAYAIASRLDDALPPGTDVSKEALGVRDDYTSLAWLAGRTALEKLGQPREAVTMFAAYGNAAQTPQTRSKGFYWAARAAEAAGDQQARTRWLEQTATYPDYFYGMLALAKLGRPLPNFARDPLPPADATVRGDPLFLAAREAALFSHSDQTAFLRAIANGAKSEQDHADAMMMAALLGRTDLYVMAGRNARVEGYDGLIAHGYPTVSIPDSERGNFTLAHAIMRQESQFDPMAVSHAGARGMMQLMPGTAREVSGQIGLAYRQSALNSDTDYNIRLGSSYISRMLRYFGGNHVLAIAAYNAGPGNVNKWLRANGDPRQGVDVLRWIEDIPIYETKNYVQRVLENLVMYDTLYPNEARRRGNDKINDYLGL